MVSDAFADPAVDSALRSSDFVRIGVFAVSPAAFLLELALTHPFNAPTDLPACARVSTMDDGMATRERTALPRRPRPGGADTRRSRTGTWASSGLSDRQPTRQRNRSLYTNDQSGDTNAHTTRARAPLTTPSNARDRNVDSGLDALPSHALTAASPADFGASPCPSTDGAAADADGTTSSISRVILAPEVILNWKCACDLPLWAAGCPAARARTAGGRTCRSSAVA